MAVYKTRGAVVFMRSQKIGGDCKAVGVNKVDTFLWEKTEILL
jgi:hypothetical protein